MQTWNRLHVLQADCKVLIVIASDDLVAKVKLFISCLDKNILYIETFDRLVELDTDVSDRLGSDTTLLHFCSVSLEQVDSGHLQLVFRFGSKGQCISLRSSGDAVGKVELVVVEDTEISSQGSCCLPEIGGRYSNAVRVALHFRQHHLTVRGVMQLSVDPSCLVGSKRQGIDTAGSSERAVFRYHLHRQQFVTTSCQHGIRQTVLILHGIQQIAVSLRQGTYLIVNVCGMEFSESLIAYVSRAQGAYQFVGSAMLCNQFSISGFYPRLCGSGSSLIHMCKLSRLIHPMINIRRVCLQGI